MHPLPGLPLTALLLVALLGTGALAEVPQFSSDSYIIIFNQNLLAGHNLVNISCSFDGVVNYTFTSPANVQFLTLDQESGNVSLTVDALSIPTGTSSTFVECSDASDPGNSNTALFQVTRIDENEYNPTFLHSALTLSFSEDLPVDSLLTIINATDEDRGDLGVIEYSISASEPLVHTLFSIDPDSGEMFLQGPLDYEVSTGFIFLVRAANTFDSNVGRNLAMTITVEDTDDTPPSFESDQYDVSVHETVLNNIIAGVDYPRPSPGFLTTSCTDPDTPTGQITYSLSSVDDVSPLVLDEATGSFSVTDDLDYETRTSYTFSVTCYDNSERNQSSTVGVDVAVLPVNEAVPEIQDDLRNVIFFETTQVGDVIATANSSLSEVTNRFLFTDTDAGPDGNVTYTLRDGTPDSGDSDFFSLGLISGDLTITEVLDNDVEGVVLIGGTIRRFFVSIVGCDEHPPSDQCNKFDFNLFVRSVNEFTPIIAQDSYILSFSESFLTGGVILSAEDVSCTDRDRGVGALGVDHVEIVTTNSAITELFHLDTQSGEILLQGSFDYEVDQSYGFEIRCYDNAGFSDRAVISIDIEPENDNRPLFDQRSYIFNVSRTTPSNRYVIGTVSATDNDLGLGGDIHYSVQPNGFVDINANGELLLFNSVLNITQRIISFSANVTDFEFTDDVLVVLEITEGNTNRPTFAEESSTAIQLSELAMVGEVIADLSCSDPDDGANGIVRFSIAGGNTDDTFSIDRVTGEITVNRALVLPQNETIETYTLSLLCEDMGVPVFSDDATIFVSVFQDDSNPPVIANTTINLFVSEDTEVNTIVATIEAEDIDSEQLNYRLENETSPGFFFIRPSTGELIVGTALDREAIDEYRMAVVVTEIRIVIGPERSDSALVNVFIRDVNDNDPVCVPSVYNTGVDETAGVGESIVQLQCNDPDLNENGQLSYALVDDFNVLSIDSTTGEITVGNTLNNTDRTLLPALVVVSDAGSPDSRSIRVQATIQVISQNNNRPTFQNLPSTVNVSEAQSLGDVFFTVTATDPDRGSFGQVRYELAGDEEDMFSIIPNTGGLSLTATLNFFTQQVHLLNISASDSDFEVFATLTVVVMDANEFIPVCESTQESFTLPESIEPSGLVFQQLSCSDDDEGTNGQISYTIESGNINNIFEIRNDSTVATTDVLDYESVQEYNLQVNVADGGSPPSSTDVMIRVTVTPVNEFPPVFSQQLYNMDVVEGTDTGTSVLQTTATDGDLSSHRDGQITYSITGPDASFFTINSGGHIIILSEIDREETGDSLVFTVVATDRAVISRSSSALVNVTVVDLDDSPPEFSNDLYVFEVNAEAVTGTAIGSVLCTDQDAPGNARVTYSFVQSAGEASTIFRIRSTGSIELIQDIPINRVFTFDVVCTGPSPGNRSDSASVSVRVLLNSTISFFPNSTYEVSIDENSALGTELLIINASSTTGAALSFNQLNLLSQFQVDETSGSVQLLGSLDFETTEFYTLRVEATDNGNPPSTNQALVFVSVVNLNDRTPRITTVPTRIVREEESVNETQVLDQYLCSDGDRGALGVVSFRIVSGDTNGVFSITRSGMLLLVGDLDYEAVTGYTLNIVCEDGGDPPLTAAIDVDVEVIPVNDNPPIFNPVGPIILAEDVPVGTDVGVPIAATDLDSPPHNALHYSLQPTGTPFSISPVTGQLSLDSSLDYETATEYFLSVQADDSGGLSDTEQFEVLSDIINITISVGDVNDNAPRFTDNFYSGTIPETASIGDAAVFGNPVRCTDRDLGPNGDVTISVVGDAPFAVQNNGVITVAGPLDHETTPLYRFSLSCTDSEQFASTFILMIVIDVDEHGPEFVTHTFNFSASEEDDVNTVIGTVEAIDLDGNQAGIVMYEFGASFNASFPFSIDEDSGDIMLAASVDFEEEQLYVFLVEAFDEAGNRDTAMVTVEVTNVNDNDPSFTDTLYFLSVRESTPPGTLVGSVLCVDLDDQVEGVPVEYSLGTQVIPFRVDPFSGDILVDGEVDYETAARYMINVFCSDSGGNQASTDVTIDLEPFNDFAPRFVIPSRNDSVLEVSEGIAVGNTLQRIIAFDQDQGSSAHSTVLYSIVGGNEDNVFTINPNNGFLRLQVQLDRETVSEYVLTLRAENVVSPDDPSNSTSLSSTISYRIAVQDINDNTPQITPDSLPLIELIESNSTMVDVAFFDCTDADEGRNGMTTFSLSSETPFDNFEITQTGTVRTITRVTSSIVLDVSCSDDGTPPRSSTVSLAINLVIANEHTPIFSSPSYSFSAPENATLASIIDCVSATDLDGSDTPDGTVRYSLTLESPQSNQSSFSIQEDTGCIFVAAPLSFDVISSYVYRVVAMDSSSEPLSSTAQVFISIIDTVIAPPFFLDTPYSQTLFENQESGTSVVQLQCDDIDDNDRVTYSITDGNGAGVFVVNSTTGLISLAPAQTLDYETSTVHVLTAVCTDVHSLQATALVTVTVSPVNEFTPTFVFGPFQIEENSIPRTEVIQLQYFDGDDGADGEVVFELIGDVLDDAFIVTQTGMVLVNGELDREDIDFYSFEVQISDQSPEPLNRRTTSHLVNITILDQNDNPPIFSSETYNFGPLNGNETIGYVVGNTTCTDIDLGVNSLLTYSFTAPGTLFGIHPESGEIFVSGDLEQRQVDDIILFVECSDQGVVRLTDTARVLVEVQEVNRNAPQFLNDSYFIEVPEDTDLLDEVILTVEAEDLDDGLNGQVRYSLLDSIDTTFFIDEDTGDISILRSLDVETRPSYLLTVIATDGALDSHTQLASRANVSVQVTGVNEFRPVCLDPIYVSIINRTTIGPIIDFQCTDDDAGTDGELSYQIISGDNRFDVNGTGFLSIPVPIPPNPTVEQILLEVAVTDGGLPSFQTVVEVVLIYSFDNLDSPTFESPTYTFNVTEASVVGTVFGVVTALDSDPGLQGHVSYSVMGTDSFEVDPVAGELFVSQPLDWEVVSFHTFSVFAEDGDPFAPLRGETIVTVYLLNENDNLPRCPGVFYTVEIFSNTTIGETVLQLDCDDPDQTPVQYALTRGQASPFSIEQSTGRVYVNGPIAPSTNTVLQVQVIGSGGEYIEITVSIQAIFINIQPPVFSEHQFSFSVSENTPLLSIIGSVAASDADSPQADLIYSIQDFLPPTEFYINPSTGEIVLTAPLDYETTQFYTYTVTVMDSGSFDGTNQLVDMATLSVNVTNINDNTPLLSGVGVYGVTVDETTALGTRVVNISCTDSDAPPFSTPQITVDLAATPFSLAAENEVYSVSVSQSLSGPASFVFDVLCTDNGGLTDEGQLYLFVPEPLAPVFSELRYEWTLSESAETGEEFPSIQAASNDGSTITYSFTDGNDGGVFYIEPDTGVVTLVRTLDYEAQTSHGLVIQAADGKGRQSSVLLVVQVSDENDEVPLTPPSALLTVRQSAPIGFPIGVLECTDQDSTANTSFSFNPPTNLFSVDDLGVVRLEGVLSETPVYSIPVLCFDVGRPDDVSMGIVTIEVEFVNVHSPEFDLSAYLFSIAEDVNPLTFVGQVSASDRDVGSYGEVSYLVTDGNPDHFFIDATTGRIGVLTSLDRETTDSYSLTVLAIDGGVSAPVESRLNQSVVVNIRVTDANDNSPLPELFTYVQAITTNHSTLSPVLSVVCSDPDLLDNGVIDYSIEPDSADDFIIQANGTLLLAREQTQQTVHSLDVVCRDRGVPTRSSSAQVTIVVDIVSVTAPVFEQDQYSAVVAENVAVHATVTRVLAVPSDPSISIVYSIVGGNERGKFTIDPFSGIVLVRDRLDATEQEEFVLTVKATIAGRRPISSLAFINITVTDINDNDPVFSSPLYASNVSETAGILTPVLQLFCTDSDLNAVINFAILYDLDVFNVTEEGLIYVASPVDFERNSSHTFEVVCSDGGDSPRTARASVRIDIDPVNEFAPSFSESQFNFTATENSFGSRIGILEAVDGDAGSHGDVRYFLQDPANSSVVLINSLTGELVVANNLDYEAQRVWDLSVIARDGGGLEAHTIVHIDVENLNDVMPVISPIATIETVSSDSPGGFPIQSYDCSDGDGGGTSLSINSGNSLQLFELNSERVLVWTGRGHTLESNAVISLTLQCVDSELPTQEVTAHVAVRILITDTPPPVFSEAVYQRNISENAAVGTTVVTVMATSQSMNTSLSFFNLPAGFPFEIDPINGEITLTSSLNREAESLYTFFVGATDVATSEVGVVLVEIRVEDSNDNPPVIFPSEQAISLPEDYDASTEFIRFFCSDSDTGANGELTFEISSGDNNGTFTLTRVSPQVVAVSLSNTLDFEEESQYELTIECRDAGSPSLSDSATLEIVVSDVNEFSPEFSGIPYVFQINETAAPGSLVGRVTAFDLDEGEEGVFVYEIQPLLQSAYFSVSNNGEIRTRTLPLNSSLNQQLQFSLTAVDTGGRQDITIVTVEVVDVNTPPIFSNFATYFVTLTTNQTHPEIILEFFCYDVDTANNSALDLQFFNEPSSIAIETSTQQGLLSASFTLVSFLAAGTYDVFLTCSDNGTPPLSSSTIATIQVQGENTAPVFQHGTVFASILETAVPGVPLTTVNATDAEGNVTYAITGGRGRGVFTIDPTTGQISLLLSLDHELTSSYLLTVSAFDDSPINPLSARTDVNIDIINVNDEYPIIRPQGVEQLVITEAQQLGVPIQTYTCEDPDDTENVIFSITPNSPPFSVSQDGEIVLDSPVDFEVQSTYVLEITCTDSEVRSGSGITLATSVTLIVVVVPVNVHAPLFNPPFELFAREDAAAGSSVGRVSATDMDLRGEITYSSNSHTDLFLVDAVTGDVVVIGTLDYESPNRQYTLSVVASDNDGTMARTASADITVFVVDVNDNPPACQPFITHQIQTGGYSLTLFAQLSCSDADSGNNSLLVYVLDEPVQGQGEIAVNESTGEVTLRGMFTTPGAVVFSVITRDAGDPPLSTQTIIALLIESSDNNSLRFNPNQFNTSISENAPIGTLIFEGTLLQEALINPTSSNVTFSLEPRLENGGSFVIEPTSASITLIDNRNLDYESDKKLFTLVVNAAINGATEATAVITLFLEDYNDNPPVFSQSSYFAQIPENQPSGVSVVRVTATDRDSELNGMVRYSTSSVDFSVDRVSGEITSLLSFDRETNERYSIVVTASDSGTPSLTSAVVVTVTILDENDEPPMFRSSLYTIDIDNLTPPNEELITLEVTDIDTNSSLLYQLITTSSEIQDLFTVDVQLGVVRRSDAEFPANHADRYNFTVLVSDGIFEDRTAVIVYVASATTDSVVFTENIEGLSYNVEEFLILQDFEIANATYSIVEGDSLGEFSIDSDGLLTVNGVLDRETIATYVLAIRVVSEEIINVYITVLVKDQNDNAPTFDLTTDEYVFTFSEGVYQNDETIGFVTANDIDEPGTNAAIIEYSIVGALIGGDGEFFINSRTGELSVKVGSTLDRENFENYTIVVRARDSGEPSPLFNAVVVVIVLTDINDNDPEFVPLDVVEYMVLLGKEDVSEETVLDNIVAILPKGIQKNVNRFTFTDPDLSSNVTASLIDMSGSDLYRLEQNFTAGTAVLVSRMKIVAAASKDVMTVQIILSDEQNESNPIVRNISLSFTDSVPTTPLTGPLPSSPSFFESEIGIAVIAMISLLIFALAIFFLCMCCYCYCRIKREKDPLKNADRMITVAQRLPPDTTKKGRKSVGRPLKYFGYSDLDPLEFSEFSPPDPGAQLLYSPDAGGEFESSFMENQYDPELGKMVDPFDPSTDTSVLSSLPLEDTNSDSSREYAMGPVLRAMLEEWDKGDELLVKGKKKRKKKERVKEKERESDQLQLEEEFLY